MDKRFDELFKDIIVILRRDYAGAALAENTFDPRYYNTAVGQAWHDGKLDELLFLRYVNQMLACIGDRHLRFTMRPSERYEPWCCGFFTRRFGDNLYITALRGETRLCPGDRITAVNGGSPAAHRSRIQKNFFFSNEPEREDWNGFLKMAESIEVEHVDGTREQLTLERHPLKPWSPSGPLLRSGPGYAILDLRNRSDLPEDETERLLPLLCRRDTPLRDLVDMDFFVNYTPLNCRLRAAGLAGLDGAEDYLQELREKSGQGFLPESDDDDTVIPGRAPERVIVLTDTWTRDGSETLALAAKRAGALLIGRPTLGTADFGGDVSLALDSRYVLTWPTLITKAAREGAGLTGRGVEPDIVIPWTPAECRQDVLMDAALEKLEKNK